MFKMENLVEYISSSSSYLHLHLVKMEILIYSCQFLRQAMDTQDTQGLHIPEIQCCLVLVSNPATGDPLEKSPPFFVGEIW